jgi:hypothetical protein
MLKLALMLSAAIYAVLVIYADGAVVPERAGPQAVAASAPDTSGSQSALVAAGGDGAFELTTTDGRVLQISSVINPSDLTMSDAQGEAIQVAAVSTLPQAAVAEAVATSSSTSVAETLPVLEVTASAVNLRSGPSTDTQVIGSLSQGMQAELVASLGNGWAEIRVIATGVEGYMAERFLTPVN